MEVSIIQCPENVGNSIRCIRDLLIKVEKFIKEKLPLQSFKLYLGRLQIL